MGQNILSIVWLLLTPNQSFFSVYTCSLSLFFSCIWCCLPVINHFFEFICLFTVICFVSCTYCLFLFFTCVTSLTLSQLFFSIYMISVFILFRYCNFFSPAWHHLLLINHFSIYNQNYIIIQTKDISIVVDRLYLNSIQCSLQCLSICTLEDVAHIQEKYVPKSQLEKFLDQELLGQ